jgi:hypothetical protein
MLSAHLLDAEPKEVDKPYAAGKGFRHAFHQMRGSRTKKEESGGILGSVHQYSDQFKQVWASLNFVDNDQAGEFLQYLHGRGQSLKVNGAFQIKIGARFALSHDSGQSRLAALSWTQEGRDRMNSEGVGYAV